MDYQNITYNVNDDIALITLNTPENLNAASLVMVEEMDDAFAHAAEEARCVIITGNGKGFSSGANLASDMGSEDQSDFDVGAALASHYNPLLSRMKDLAVPIVTAVNGAAAGVGCSIALAGDIILASKNAYFMQAFRRIGLVPDGGSSYLLPRMIGRARAMEMMLLGDKISAETAYEWGMINRVTAQEDLLGEARNYALKLANGPTHALGLIRQLAWESLDSTWDQQIALERKLQREAGQNSEFIEGITAFLEKRPANFKKTG